MPPKKKIAKKKETKKKAPPKPTDPLYRFYVSLFEQNPKSQMAIKWLCENGLGHMVINFDGLSVSKDTCNKMKD
jgi:hypothetical protein